MYGLVFEIIEEFVCEKHGRKLWHTIKAKANCHVPDQAFLRRSHYDDSEIFDLIHATSEVLNIPEEELLEVFGRYMIRHHFANGYNELLRANGATLRQWLSNLNSLHDHVAKSFSSHQAFFQAPIYWCEDCDEVEASILLHYYSFRGITLVPMTVGIVKELAKFTFAIDVTLDQLALQGVNGAEFTTWRITATDSSKRWKLSPTVAMDDVIDFSQMEMPSHCPFSGRALSTCASSVGTAEDFPIVREGLNYEKLQEVFPFHVLVDRRFTILQVGQSLPNIMGKTEDSFFGRHIGDVLDISRPVMGSSWDWKALKKLEDQHFFLVPNNRNPNRHKASNNKRNSMLKNNSQRTVMKRKVSMADNPIRFKGSMVEMDAGTKKVRRRRRSDPIDDGVVVMFVLAPDAHDVTDLRRMGLTMTDLPLHTCQRDAVFLGEYIAQEVDMANNLDKLSKKLEVEKNLSNMLLYNMLPKEIADELRSGNTVEPKHHEKVTLFFSDIVGFTSICDKVDPWAVIDMLNQLYSVMDHLASHFNLYKVETIGDAYMCCSGLPFPDDYHAENVANFAVAVLECVKHVLSPVDGTPINLRIGIHTGSCTAGVVGSLTPHYCLFGDMINVTARHESTGLRGKIQCSSELFGRLTHFSMYADEQYTISHRGLVDMKGKGSRYTYWLESGTDANEHACPISVQMLSNEVKELLDKKSWRRRSYFKRSGTLRNCYESQSVFSGDSGGTASTADSSESHDNTPAPAPSSAVKILEVVSDEDGGNSHSSGRDPDELDAMIQAEGSSSSVSEGNGLLTLVLDDNLSHEDMVSYLHRLLSPLLRLCLSESSTSDPPIDNDPRDQQLHSFIDLLSRSFKRDNAFHCFCRSAHMAAWANYLFKQVQEKGAGRTESVNNGPWFRLTVTLAALFRDCKHRGVSDRQLEFEEHTLYEMHGGNTCQASFGIRFGLDLLSDQFQALYDDIVMGFPQFLYLMKKLESPAAFQPQGNTVGHRNSLTDTVAAMAIVLRMASLGHFALKYEDFILWNEAAFAEKRLASLADRGIDPTPVWNEQCVRFIEKKVLSVAEQCEKLLPKGSLLQDSIASNLREFATLGKAEQEKYPRRKNSMGGLDASERMNLAVDVFH